MLENVIQFELKSSTHGSQQAPDATLSTPQSHPAIHDVNYGEPQGGSDPLGTDQNKSTGRRRGAKGECRKNPPSRRRITKGIPPSIIVPHPVIPLSSAGPGENAPPSSPKASEKTLQTYTTDHASIDDLLTSNECLQRKRRKNCFGAVAASNTQAEVETIQASKPNTRSTSVQPQTSDEAAVEDSAIPPGLVHKLGLIGGIEVMRDLRQALLRLRSRDSQDLLIPKFATSATYIGAAVGTPSLPMTAQMLLTLRNDLELTEIEEQLYRFRKRLALCRFFDIYQSAQEHPESFLQATAETMEGPSRNGMSKQGFGMKSRVLNRIVDLMFPKTAYADEGTVAAEGSFGQIQRRRQRAAVVKKVQDWRRNAKPWFAMVQRFGEGILLLLPKTLSEEK